MSLITQEIDRLESIEHILAGVYILPHVAWAIKGETSIRHRLSHFITITIHHSLYNLPRVVTANALIQNDLPLRCRVAGSCTE